eukprot:1195100-Prorocentrum_minimum.AAC.1
MFGSRWPGPPRRRGWPRPARYTRGERVPPRKILVGAAIVRAPSSGRTRHPLYTPSRPPLYPLRAPYSGHTRH